MVMLPFFSDSGETFQQAWLLQTWLGFAASEKGRGPTAAKSNGLKRIRSAGGLRRYGLM
jgi:hypothetical protein